jgi:hypothetical protein
MDDFKKIEVEIAKRYGAITRGTKKSIGDFLINEDTSKAVNVKSNNVDKNNYSPNIISAKRLLNWLKKETNEIYFIFVDYKKTNNKIEIISESGLIPIHHISWDCLTIESQGWGVIQMNKKLKIDTNQDIKTFLSGLKSNYEKYLEKELVKFVKIREMIKDF